jgi:hypothetical protein
LFIYYFTVTKPFSWCAIKDEFEEGVINKYYPKEEPSIVEKWITIKLYIQVPTVITKDTDDGN